MKADTLPAMSEKEFQAQVIQLAKLHGWKVAHFRSVRVLAASGKIIWQTPVAADGKGWPDTFMVRGERAIAPELKVLPNKPTPDQLEWLAALNAAGIYAPVWYPSDWPEIVKELDQ